MAAVPPFRFLDLPKELRLMVYELLPVITRHHAIKFRQHHEDFAFTLVSKRVPGVSMLATCRQIHDEAVTLRRTMKVLNTEPLRMVAHWRAVDSEVMRIVLRYASETEGPTTGTTEDLEQILQRAKDYRDGINPPPDTRSAEEDLYFLRFFGVASQESSRLRTIHSDFTSYHEVYAVLHRNSASGPRRRVEIAVDCTLSSTEAASSLDSSCLHFYNWLSDMHDKRKGDVNMHINLRPMPETDDVKVKLECNYAFWNEYNPPSVFVGRRWSYELGDWVEGEEWADLWAAGEKS